MVGTKMFIINSDILPKAYEKVIKAKLLLRTGDSSTIQEACRMAGVSRSAFYKYKDSVFDYTAQERGRTVTLFMILKHTPWGTFRYHKQNRLSQGKYNYYKPEHSGYGLSYTDGIH